jgi:hypothetical protein
MFSFPPLLRGSQPAGKLLEDIFLNNQITYLPATTCRYKAAFHGDEDRHTTSHLHDTHVLPAESSKRIEL